MNKSDIETIFLEIKNNNKITQKELAKKYNCHERTIRNKIKKLKDDKRIIYKDKKVGYVVLS